MKVFKGQLDARGLKIAVVVSGFNEAITSKMLEGALDEFLKLGGLEDNIDVYWVPGSFEIPIVLKKLAQSQRYDGVAALGAIVRGETPHFDFVASETTKGIAKVMLDESIPVAFGVITADSMEQAFDRAGGKIGNKGRHAIQALVETIRVIEKIE